MNVFLSTVLTFAAKNKFSDVHINAGEKIRIRNHVWEVETIDEIDGKVLPPITIELVETMMRSIVPEKVFLRFELQLELDTSCKIEDGTRFRVNFYKDSWGYSIAFRLISGKIPTIEQLGLGKGIQNLCKKSKWLVLVTGPTWSGKSTNLAAMINYINQNYKKHIITIEDPIEFSFRSDKSLVNQREIWWHTKSFANAIRSAMREDPDIIMIWEMRDPETIQAAITLAETGHLVLSTLHTNDSVQTIDRIVDVFPADKQSQIRMQLAQSLVGVISQRLIPKIDNSGRVAVREILITNDAVRNLIIRAKTHQLYNVLEVGQDQGMILMDKYLLALYNRKIIDKNTLLNYSRDKENIKMMID